VKNPLVAINTFAQLLPRKYDSEDFRSAFSEVVQKEIGRINKVVEILFEFARHPRLALQRANVNESVQSVLKTYDQILRERAIQLETEWDPDLPEVNLDPIYFSQAVSNVLQNSIDAMPSGGKLRVRTRKDNGRCEVVVSDTGPGIAEQDAPLMFMPFFSTKEQGMGMGLTIANRIMRQHEGALKFLRNSDGGSAFAIELPLSGKVHADSSRH
jgi:two-component system, NtrC family, sensor histidine kinase HydH